MKDLEKKREREYTKFSETQLHRLFNRNHNFHKKNSHNIWTLKISNRINHWTNPNETEKIFLHNNNKTLTFSNPKLLKFKQNK